MLRKSKQTFSQVVGFGGDLPLVQSMKHHQKNKSKIKWQSPILYDENSLLYTKRSLVKTFASNGRLASMILPAE